MNLKDYEYYRTDLGVLYNADCLEIMPHLEPVDLVLTDPPYGIGQKIERENKSKKSVIKRTKYIVPVEKWDNIPPPEYFEILYNISKNQIIFGGNFFVEYLKNSPCWIVWDKDRKNRMADCELVYTSFDTAVRKIKYTWNGMIKEVPETRYHPTQKPVGLIIQILNKYGNQEWSTLDTHCGSGSTLVACERLNRRWIGIEIEEKYCAIAKKRIEKERSQLKLF